MALTCEGPPSAKGDPLNSSCLPADSSEINSTPSKTQRLSVVDRARRELLLDAIDEDFADVMEYADAGQSFVFHRDRTGLFHTINVLVAKVIDIGVTASELRELLAAPSREHSQ